MEVVSSGLLLPQFVSVNPTGVTEYARPTFPSPYLNETATMIKSYNMRASSYSEHFNLDVILSPNVAISNGGETLRRWTQAA